MRGLWIVTCLSFLAAGGGLTSAIASDGAHSGALCIAPFNVREPSPGRPLSADPILSQETWPPSAGSAFTFRVDKRLKATVRNHEMALVRGVPTERKVQVEVRLDGKPFETFWLDLRKEPDHQVCLWLYPGYWHWINIGWDAIRGCKCELQAR